MRSKPLGTPPYRLHKPTGQAVVTLAGKGFYLGRHGTPGSEARSHRLVGEFLTQGRQIVPSPGKPTEEPTVTVLVVAYVEHADAYYQKDGNPTGEATNIRYALKPLRRLYGDTLAR